jgi:hypothetical protein
VLAVPRDRNAGSPQPRLDRGERVAQSRFGIIGMQPVEQQQRLDLLVTREAFGQLPSAFTGSKPGHDPGQRDAVHVEHRLDQLARRLARHRVRGMAQRRIDELDTVFASHRRA